MVAGEGEESAGEVEEVDNNQKVRYQLPSNLFM
jgi:hypothetical protein